MPDSKIVTTYEELSDIEKRLLDLAEKVRENAYEPYSNYLVGAALLVADGQIVKGANFENALFSDGRQIIAGANFENASSPLSMCAERIAYFTANAMGYRNFSKIAIITRPRNFNSEEAAWSCGACRQVMSEFSELSGIDLEVIVANTQKTIIWKTRLSELLKEPFGPGNLGVNLEPYRK